MKHIKVSKRYALALFNSAKQQNVVEVVKNDTNFIRESIHATHELYVLLKSPVIQSWKKKGR